ncbi:T-cell immunoglobulin and mucin domain-containing protein 4 isoform X2 [Sorex araneus]|uniref:T-cell immunoglobulin and mucin domain-containing protein 4 isoform X2 n=1 Tax=Sorex araneus TaxID=42254 RepID=UPI002433E58F|nr:T-cell immunoglobulin and mucin domain-containing protein 4 isoform X2 [Sorex araneus]
MPRDHLLLWLLMELGRFYLTPADPVTVVSEYLGRTVRLPCQHSSWDPRSNSMCWGKGECPKSKCRDELAHTDGTRVLSRASARYSLRGPISRGDVSLTISNTRRSDNSVYCCRIEVPGWFNDIKRNIQLQLKDPPPRTTRRPKTTTTSSTALLPTTRVPTPHLTTAAPPRASTWVPTEATTCPLSAESSPPATPPTLATEPTTSTTLATKPATPTTLATELATEPATEEMAPTPGRPWSPSAATSGAPEPQTWVPPSGPGTATRDMGHVSHGAGVSESSEGPEGVEQIQMADHRDLLMVIVPSLGLLLFLVLLGVFLRGKITKTICIQKHSRLEESKRGLDGLQHGREDEDGLFTL